MKENRSKNKRIKIDYLSRVEGETGLHACVKGDRISVEFRVFEAPRFFESILRGRTHQDAIDFTSRICGICPVAYQMSAVHAIEKIFGIEVTKQVRDLRRLFYTGEWIESHSLHVYFLHGPDFYGAANAWENSAYLPFAKLGLAFKKMGNAIISAIGGRPIHPVSAKAGGFYRMPEKGALTRLLPELEKNYEQSLRAISWAAGLPFTKNSSSREMQYVCLRHPDEYPMNEGRVVSNFGLDAPMDSFMDSIKEHQMGYSNTLHSKIEKNQENGKEKNYLVGPIARVNLNFEMLPNDIREEVKKTGVSVPILNIEMGIIARVIEIAYAFHEAIRLIKEYEGPEAATVPDIKARSGTATWITEAPRGILIHRYTLDDRGYVENCTIIPPTSQNAGHIEGSIFNFLKSTENADKSAEMLKKVCEKIIRSYDPCISCSVHLVKID